MGKIVSPGSPQRDEAHQHVAVRALAADLVRVHARGLVAVVAVGDQQLGGRERRPARRRSRPGRRRARAGGSVPSSSVSSPNGGAVEVRRERRPGVAVVEREDRREVRARRAREPQPVLLRAGVRALVRADPARAVVLDAHAREQPVARAAAAVGAGVVLLERPQRRARRRRRRRRRRASARSVARGVRVRVAAGGSCGRSISTTLYGERATQRRALLRRRSRRTAARRRARGRRCGRGRSGARAGARCRPRRRRMLEPPPPPRSDVPPSPSEGALVSGGRRSPPCRWRRRPPAVDGRAERDPDPDLAELAPQDVGPVAGGGHPRAVDLGGRGERCRCPRRCSRPATSRGRARSRCAGSGRPCRRRRATRGRSSRRATMSREWAPAAARSALVLAQRREPARGALAVVQAQHRRADRREVAGGGVQRGVGAGGGARLAAAPGEPAGETSSAHAATASARRTTSVPSPLGSAADSNPPEPSRRDLDARSACHDSRRARGVAQPGSAPALGAGGRGFESRRPDHRSCLLEREIDARGPASARAAPAGRRRSRCACVQRDDVNVAGGSVQTMRWRTTLPGSQRTVTIPTLLVDR